MNSISIGSVALSRMGSSTGNRTLLDNLDQDMYQQNSRIDVKIKVSRFICDSTFIHVVNGDETCNIYWGVFKHKYLVIHSINVINIAMLDFYFFS